MPAKPVVPLIFLAITACQPGAQTSALGLSSPIPKPSTVLPSSPKGEAPVCDLSGPWSLVLVTSGGIAGTSDMLQVTSEGSVTLAHRNASEAVTSALGKEALDDLRSNLAAACPHLMAHPRLKPCPDCIQYQLDLNLPDEPIQWITQTGESLAPPLEALLGTLNQITADVKGGQGF